MHRLALLTTFALLCPATLRADETAVKTKPAPPRVQLAILLDTSGSMDGLIEQARTQLWQIVNELATANREGAGVLLEVALYEYGQSPIAAEEGHLRQIVPLTDDLDKVSEELFALTTNGGEEYCGWVVRSATKGLKWSERDEDLKLIFVCGNEAFTQGPVSADEAVQKAIERGITVNTIFCGNEAEGINTGWKKGADLADGSFHVIDQNKKVAAIATPFDEKLAKLGAEVNRTYVQYGAAKEREAAKALQREADAKVANRPAAAATRAAFKGKQQYRGSRDLVDAVKDGLDLDDVKDEELPEEVRKLDAPGRAKYVAEKQAERDRIQKEINELDKKRREFVAEERRKRAEETGETSLDEAVLKAVREQATRKRFQFDE